MANTKISALTVGSPAQTGDLIPIARSGSNYALLASDIAGLALQTATVVITSAQFLAMNTSASTDVTIVAAQGSGKIIIPVFASVNMNYPASGGVAYTTGSGATQFYQTSSSTHNLSYGTTGNGICPSLSNTQIEASVSTVVFGVFPLNGNGSTGFSVSTIANNALTMNISTATQYTAGNSTFTVTVWYQVVSVS